MGIRRRGEAQWWEGLVPESPARGQGAFAAAPADAPSRREALRGIATKFRVGAKHRLPEWPKTSGRPPVLGLRSRSIRKDIIGPTFRIAAHGGGSRKGFRQVAGAFALLQKQPCHRGVGLIGHPLIQQGGDFLAQVGGVGKTRKLEALQRIFGSGEKEVPGRLAEARSHVNLRYFAFAHNNV